MMMNSLERVQVKMFHFPPCVQDAMPETVAAISHLATSLRVKPHQGWWPKGMKRTWVFDNITESLNQLSLKIN